MKKVFIFDLDDTLMWNEYTYSNSFIKFYSYLTKLWGKRIPFIGHVAAEQENITLSMVTETNPETGKAYGFSMERYPLSLVRSYKELCKEGFGKFDEYIAQEIYKIGLSTFNPKQYRDSGKVLGAELVLNFLLAQKDTIILMTKGDPRVQERKIKALELTSWFKEIHIVADKTKECFFGFKKRFPTQPVWKVGNSFKSDMKPALEAGLKGIFIPYSTWKHEVYDRKDAENEKNIVIISDIRQIITFHLTGTFDT